MSSTISMPTSTLGNKKKLLNISVHNILITLLTITCVKITKLNACWNAPLGTISNIQWLQSRLSKIYQCNKITCWLKGNLIPGQVPLSRFGADSIRFTSNPQTLGSCVVALIQNLSAGGEGPHLKLCSHQDQTGTVPSLFAAQIKGRILSPSPGPKAQLKPFAHAVSKEAVKKIRTGISPLTHAMSL